MTALCSVEGCEIDAIARSLCAGHYQRLRKNGDLNWVPNTERARRAQGAFREQLEQLGASLEEAEWLGMGNPHAVRCPEGHLSRSRPADVLKGHGVCRICARNSADRAFTEFRRTLESLGAVLLERTPLGNKAHHRVICREGHQCNPRPNDVQQGHGICKVCVGMDSTAAAARFGVALDALGVRLAEGHWLGSNVPHRIACEAGHIYKTSPTRPIGCPVCSGRDTATKFARFVAQVAALGGEVVEGEWLGSGVRHEAICKNGHQCWPRPHNVAMGVGICWACRGQHWDISYVVLNHEMARVKYGITSGDPARRLDVHRRAGYVDVLRLVTASDAVALEAHVAATLKLAGMLPVAGREYHDIAATATITDIVDHWPGAKAL